MQFKNLICRLALVLLLLGNSTVSQAASDVRKAENRVIYEVFVRNFSPQGNLKGVEAQIPRLKELGVDVVWLMPIYKLGDIGKWGTYSSPYAVKDYTKIDPDNGSEQDLRDLVKTIHAHGMEIWFDWVGNHTSLDNVWVSSHPDFYKWNGSQIVHPNGWNDVYQLNNDNTAMQDEMIRCMQYWVNSFDIDGYRCDYASGPSPELWRKASERVLKNGKRIAWLAEDDSRPELVSKGYFDYNYAWGFRDRLVEFTKNLNVGNLKNECSKLHADNNYKGRSRMVYLSNHDVVQDNKGTEDVHFGRFLRPMTVLEFTIYGMPLLYNGQEIQYKAGQVLLSEKTPINWNNPDQEMTSLIKTLCNLKHTQPALNTGSESGSLINFTASDSKVYAYERRRGDEHVVVMLNFGDNASTFKVTGDLPNINGVDAFTGKKAKLASGESFTLPALGYAVYITDGSSGTVTPTPTPTPTPDPTPDPTAPAFSSASIYVKDFSGWNNLYVYGWADGKAELFGAWPGAKIAETVSIDGVSYKKVNVPAGYSGSYNLIFNNNADTQYDGAYVSIDSSSCFEISGGSWSEATIPSEKRTYNIYFEDNTGWGSLYLYGWAEGQPELFGGWPGVKVSDRETINGVEYKVLRNVPETATAYHLIYNNNSGRQNDISGTYAIDNTIFFSVGANGTMNQKSTPVLYVRDYTGWNNLYVYGWASGKPELFGGWPGKKVSETMSMGGVTYRKINLPSGYSGEYNLIFNNNAGTQFDIPNARDVQKNIILTVDGNGIAANKPQPALYVKDNAGWSDLYVYAWADGQPELFGGWPGIHVTEIVSIDGYSYKKVALPSGYNGDYNLIFTDGGDLRLEGMTVNANNSRCIELTRGGCSLAAMPVESFNIYISDLTGWNNLYLYGWADGQPEIFGGWPGVKVTDSESINGVEYKVIRNVRSTNVGYNFIYNNNAGTQYDIAGSQVINKHIFLSLNPAKKVAMAGVNESELIEDEVEAEYYTLNGIRLAEEPTIGIYIIRKGDKVIKMVK